MPTQGRPLGPPFLISRAWPHQPLIRPQTHGLQFRAAPLRELQGWHAFHVAVQHAHRTAAETEIIASGLSAEIDVEPWLRPADRNRWHTDR
jgi:hypothetical protein